MSVTALLLAAALTQSSADDAAPDDADKSQQQKWNDFYAAQAAEYTIVLDDDPRQTLELQPKPVLYWSNPVRGGETNGAVFVWTREYVRGTDDERDPYFTTRTGTRPKEIE